jgi:hypothetical protein
MDAARQGGADVWLTFALWSYACLVSGRMRSGNNGMEKSRSWWSRIN